MALRSRAGTLPELVRPIGQLPLSSVTIAEGPGAQRQVTPSYGHQYPLSPGSTGTESPPAAGMACGPGSALTAQVPEGHDGHLPSSPTWSWRAHSPGCIEALCILQFLLDKTPELVTPTPPWPSGNCLRGQSCPSPLEVPGTPWGSRDSTGQGWPGHLDQVASGHLRQPAHLT